ncbi:MFS transporter [Sphingobium boeckii]|uniref:MFS family permease n=1 Tax=Sphingobium boeckii TaxID=1082345 RepID=A0A7W9AL71_9SPHN|nr:MFS transporter [Sphingobium boeckii]MBB5687713.1 MFS family permease [Sphingobium boeckii]
MVAALVGVTLGLTSLPFYTLGVFARPIAEDMGWPQSTVQSGLVFSMIGTVMVAGLAGWMIDRFGVRRVTLVSQMCLVLGFLLLASQNGDPLMWRASWFLIAVLGIGTSPLTWSRGIADWFVNARGFALGIALSGSGITAFAAPPLVDLMIQAYGWRTGYLAIGAAVLFVALPTAWLLFHMREPQGPAGQDVKPMPLYGLTFGEALRGYRFWLILASFAGISFAIGGSIPNLVPMLKQGGVEHAALYASLLGVNVIVGRILAGYLLDRFWAPLVAVAMLALPATACVLLALDLSPGIAAALVGLAGGAEFDLIAYLCARYFGMRNYGRIYAWQWAGFSLAAGAGSYGFALVFDATGSYDGALYAAAGLMGAGGLALLALGRYPQWDIKS